MKLNDSKTAQVAEAVSAILSGKGKEYTMDKLHAEALEINESIKSVKYDTVIKKLESGEWETSYDVKKRNHLEIKTDKGKKMTIFVEDAQEEMDPRDHVSEKDGKFVVVNRKGEEVKSFDNKEEAEEYAVSNHDSLMKEDLEDLEDLEEASKLSSKEEAMVLKVIGSTKTSKEATSKVAKEMKLSAKEAAAIVKELMAKYESVEAVEAVEEINEEVNEDDKAAYKAFFAKAMKKFGIDDITDLKGDKKKEFFDYVDANWKAKDE